ncbi:MAG: hypothetical protein GX786_07280, partial [Clostridiales bacterium]|nr:hypothetical protein [Clostridiales bacterium]
MYCDAFVVSSLSKVFPEEKPLPLSSPLSLLQNDSVSFQLAYFLHADWNQELDITISSPLLSSLSFYQVMLSPSSYPCHPVYDERYLKTLPGLFPDRLKQLSLPSTTLRFVARQWRSLWIKVTSPCDLPAGTYPVTVTAKHKDHDPLFFSVTVEVTLIPTSLLENPIYHTEWFHGDCLADYYQVESLSQAHFDIMENFISLAAKRDINTLLTPIFTPPLDTKVGKERTTIQLVQVFRDQGIYHFDFSLFHKWVSMCQRCGIKYFEISHLFSQWGAAYPPKIMAWVEGEYCQIFGWEQAGTGKEYAAFLQTFLPLFLAELETLGIQKQCIFHISDEPQLADLDQYKAARAIVMPYLKDSLVIDALSDIDFYHKKVITHPVPSNDHIEDFLHAGVADLWTYYCT